MPLMTGYYTMLMPLIIAIGPPLVARLVCVRNNNDSYSRRSLRPDVWPAPFLLIEFILNAIEL